MSTTTISENKLRQELQHFNLQAGASAAALDLGRLLESADAIYIVKQNARRQVFRIQSDGRRFYLKRTTIVRTKDRFRLLLLPNRKKAEWRNLHRLAAMGIKVPEPILWGEALDLRPPQYFILSTEVAGKPLEMNDERQWRRLGEFIAFLHGKGIYHADLHPGNIHLTAEDGHALLDVQSVFFFRRLPRVLKLRNIGRFLHHYFHSKSFPLRVENFLQGYNAGGTARFHATETLLSVRGQLERHFRSRTRRCLTSSSEFESINDLGLKGFRRRGFDWDKSRLRTSLLEGTILKPGTVFAHRGVCIKRRRRRKFHRDRCRTSWIMSRALEVRGIEVPRSLAYFVSGQSSYFLSEYIEGGQLLNEFLSSLAVADHKRRALKALAQWIRQIHSSRLWQRDFKSSNILHENGTFYLLDMDSVCAKKPDDSRKIMNLAQLNASISNAVTLKDRVRFFYYYTSGENWNRERRRAAYQRIWEISRGKNTAIYDLDLDELLQGISLNR